MKQRDSRLWRGWLTLIGLALLASLLTPALASASTLISEGYLSSGPIATGSIVALQKNTSDVVTSAMPSTSSNLLGVAVNSSNAPVSIDSSQNSQVQVATNGVEPVLVSNINGSVSVGDPITASPIEGVGMLATANTKIIGIAQDSFPNDTASAEMVNHQKIEIGTVPVLINVSYFFKQPDKTLIPAALQNIANSLAGKTVSSLPIIASLIIFFVTLVIVVAIIYSMIHGSIISVGRNPLSQSAVYRNVIQMSILVVIIIAVSVVAIYMVLTRL